MWLNGNQSDWMVIRISRQSSTVEATGRTLPQKCFSSWKRLTSLIGDAVNAGGALPDGALPGGAVAGSSMTCNDNILHSCAYACGASLFTRFECHRSHKFFAANELPVWAMRRVFTEESSAMRRSFGVLENLKTRLRHPKESSSDCLGKTAYKLFHKFYRVFHKKKLKIWKLKSSIKPVFNSKVF